MPSAGAQEQPTPDPSDPSTPPDPTAARTEEYLYRGESRLQACAQLTTGTMTRRLPAPVLRSLKTAWHVDRGATAGLPACQAGTGVLAALGLLAATGTITALFSSGDITERLACCRSS
ncbi:hypothetical protein [Streptomyces sp. NRRL WC-3549]|uniref:hypothetical protein n=1 Tax=Streptomyces sp. NRRL WC-3549 TaxID=1463925 RepID=UPI000AD3D995